MFSQEFVAVIAANKTHRQSKVSSMQAKTMSTMVAMTLCLAVILDTLFASELIA